MIPWWHYAVVYGAAALFVLYGAVLQLAQLEAYRAGKSIFKHAPEAWFLAAMGALLIALAATGHVV